VYEQMLAESVNQELINNSAQILPIIWAHLLARTTLKRATVNWHRSDGECVWKTFKTTFLEGL